MPHRSPARRRAAAGSRHFGLRAVSCVLLLHLAYLGGCTPGDPGDDPGVDGATDDRAAWPLSADDRLFTIEGLSSPEAVKYDPDRDRYLVSNWGDSDDEEANDGFLTLASAEDGRILELRWATGTEEHPLLAPRGMALRGDTVWVADARGVHGFHRDSGEHLAFVDLGFTDPGFLNDLAVGPGGGLWVTDTGTSRLILIHQGRATVIAEGERLGSPNGIAWDAEASRFVLVPWEPGGDSIRSFDPATGTIEILGRSPGGRFDGVEPVGGALIVASQLDSALHLVEEGRGRPWRKVPGSPADISVDGRRNRVAVPYIALDRVDVFRGPAGAR